MGSFSNLFGKFKLLDFMSKEIRLNIDGANTVHSYSGSIFTLVYLFVLCGVLTFAGRNYFKNDNPTTYSETYVGTDSPRMNMHEQQFVPWIYANDPYTGFIPPNNLSNYIYLEVTLFYQGKFPLPNGTLNSTTKTIYFDTAPCSNLTADEFQAYNYINHSNPLYSRMMKYGLCIRSNSSLQIFGLISSSETQYLQYSIKPCVQAEGATNCMDQDHIEAMYFYLVTPSSNMDLANKTNPLQFLPNANNAMYLIPTMVQWQTVSMKKNLLYDYMDSDIIPAWYQKGSFYDIREMTNSFIVRDRNMTNSSITCLPSSVGPNGDGSCAQYYVFYFRPTATVQVVRRKYITIFDTFSMIGGINDSAFTILLLIYTWYNSRTRDDYIISRIFPFLGELDKEHPEVSKTIAHSDGSAKEGRCARFQTALWHFFGAITCSKKYKNKPLRDLALESIYSNLDVIHFIRELHNLKALTMLFLKPRQLKLVPWLEFSKRYMVKQDQINQETMSYKALIDEIEKMKPKNLHLSEIKPLKPSLSSDVSYVPRSPLTSNMKRLSIRPGMSLDEIHDETMGENKVLEEFIQGPFDNLVCQFLQNIPGPHLQKFEGEESPLSLIHKSKNAVLPIVVNNKKRSKIIHDGNPTNGVSSFNNLAVGNHEQELMIKKEDGKIEQPQILNNNL